MSLKLELQKCFKVPRAKLGLFLDKLGNNSSEHLHLRAKYIFEAGDYYDVVVNYFGASPFDEADLKKFYAELLK